MGPSPIVLLTTSTGVGSLGPRSPSTVGAVLVDPFEVEKARSLLLEVGKHTRKDLGTVAGVLADRRILADCSQEVGVTVGSVLWWEELIEF